jgi:uncharacterized membrane protein
MTKRFYGPYVLLALALVGIAVAFYDAYQLYNGQTLWCPPPINGCNEVANSPYARIYNLPVGYFGVVYYLYMFGLAALLAFDPLSRGLRFAALAYSALGVCFSIYFMYLRASGASRLIYRLDESCREKLNSGRHGGSDDSATPYRMATLVSEPPAEAESRLACPHYRLSLAGTCLWRPQ